MPVLNNARHERFAQLLAQGNSATDAYAEAGYKGDRTAASRLSTNVNIQSRVAEILERGAARAEITEEMVLRELAKIGFSDIRKAVTWNGHLVRTEDNPDGGDTLVITNVVTNHVTLIDSDELDPDTVAAIAEISQNATGGVKIKFHDKQAALVNIGKHLGMFVERTENVNLNYDVTDQPLSENEWAEQHTRPN